MYGSGAKMTGTVFIKMPLKMMALLGWIYLNVARIAWAAAAVGAAIRGTAAWRAASAGRPTTALIILGFAFVLPPVRWVTDVSHEYRQQGGAKETAYISSPKIPFISLILNIFVPSI
jgi:hypothetical protein